MPCLPCVFGSVCLIVVPGLVVQWCGVVAVPSVDPGVNGVCSGVSGVLLNLRLRCAALRVLCLSTLCQSDT